MTDAFITFASNVVQGLVLILIGSGTRALFGIRDELRKLNGRIVRIEERQTGHEALDDARQASLLREIERMETLVTTRR